MKNEIELQNPQFYHAVGVVYIGPDSERPVRSGFSAYSDKNEECCDCVSLYVPPLGNQHRATYCTSSSGVSGGKK